MIHARRNRLLLDLLAGRQAEIRASRALARAQLGHAHPDVGRLEAQLAELSEVEASLVAELAPRAPAHARHAPPH